jgi:hypothetical protein
MNTLPVEIPDVYTVPQPSSVPATLLQDFEYEDSYYEVFQANASLSTEITHTGNSSLKMTGIGGEWHTVGAYLYNRPLDLTSFSRICIWVYDDTNGNNTMGLRLLDKFGGSWEVWSDWLNACDTTHTQLNSWVRMCFNLAVFDQDQVDLSALAKVQMCMYSNGDYYFDDITVY